MESELRAVSQAHRPTQAQTISVLSDLRERRHLAGCTVTQRDRAYIDTRRGRTLWPVTVRVSSL